VGSGAQFGFRRTVPHLVGTALGIGSMALIVAGGLGLLITTFITDRHESRRLYLPLYLRIRSPVPGPSSVAMSAGHSRMLQAGAFQAITPRPWIFALGAITTFRPRDLPTATSSWRSRR